jgi:hypothetical protein
LFLIPKAHLKIPDKHFGLFTTTILISISLHNKDYPARHRRETTPVAHRFFSKYTPNAMEEIPTVITRKVEEIKQKHNSALPKVTATIGVLLLFLELGQQPLRLLSINPPP